MRSAALPRFAALGASVALLGCSGGGTSKPLIHSFVASPATLPAGGGTVVLSWSVSGPADLSITPGIGRVAGNTVAVTVTAPTRFQLVATSPIGAAAANASVAVGPPITVTARVMTRWNSGLAGYPVLVLGQGIAAVTDGNGMASLPGVVAPYELAVGLAAGDPGGWRWGARVWEG